MWSDPNLTPYMAVTAHWIRAQTQNTPKGPKRTYTLQADLIGFLRVPGRHTGDHLAHAFIRIIDRLKIAEKVS
jgi:hypothetical protein